MKKTRLLAWLLFLLVAGFLIYANMQLEWRRRDARLAEPKTSIPRNVYLITTSGLHPDHLNSYLYQHGQTPAMDFLAYDGVRFANAFTTSPESLPAHLSMLTGLYPFRSWNRQTTEFAWGLPVKRLPKAPALLPQILKDMGYRTAAFLSDPALRHPSLFGQWIDTVLCGDRVLSSWQGGYDNTSLAKITTDWVDENRSTAHFVWLNFYEPTPPFEPPAPYGDQYRNHLYDGEVAALDERIGLFVHHLKQRNLYDQSILIFTSPYAENEAFNPIANTNGNTVRVPLIITARGLLPEHKEYLNPASLADITPTVLMLLNQPTDPKSDGIPLFQPGNAKEVSRQLIAGATLFPKLLGMPEKYFLRTQGFHYISSPEEQLDSRYPDSLNAEQKEIWTKKIRAMLTEVAHLPPAYWKKATPPVQASASPEDPFASINKAVLHARQNEFAEGVAILNTLNSTYPSRPYILSLLAEMTAASGDTAGALENYRLAYKHSGNPQWLLSMARLELQTGNNAGAEKLLEKARASLTSYELHSITGIAAFQLGHMEKAFPEFDLALQTHPRWSEAYLFRGIGAAQSKQFEKAEKDLRKALEFSPEDGRAYRQLAELFYETGRKNDAIPYLRQLLQLDPKDFHSMFRLAQLQQESGNTQEVRRLCEEIILYCEDPQILSAAKNLFGQL